MAEISKPKKNKPRLTKAELSKEIGAKPGSFSGLSVDAFLLLDENLNLLSINDAGQKMFGVSKAGVFGKCILDVIPDIKNTVIYKKYRHVLKTGKSIATHLELGGRHLSVQVFKQGDALGMIAADITERKRAEERLRLARQEWESIFDAIGQPTVIVDPQYNLIVANRAAVQATGISTSELAGRKCYQVFHDRKAEGPPEDCPLQRMLVSGRFETSEMEVENLKGFFLVSCTPMFDGRGRLEKVIHIATDITERKKMEAKLSRVDRALRVTSSSNVTLVHATEELEYLREVCRIAVEVGGYRLAWVGFAEQDAKKTVRPVAYAGYEKGYLEKLNITWADTERGRGPTGTAIRGGVPSVARYILTDPNFEPWRAEALKRGYASSIALPLRGDGVPLGALNIYAAEPDAFDEGELGVLKEMANDLAYGIIVLRLRAERKRAEEKIRYQSNLVENVSDAIISTDLDFNILSWNKAAEAIYGWQADEVVGKSMADLIRTEYPYTQREQVLEQFRAKGLWTGEVIQTRRDGTPVHIMASVSLVKDSTGNPAGAVAINRDITERKQVEDAMGRRETQLSLILDNVCDVIFVIAVEPNDHFRFISVNRRFAEVTGLPEDQVVGKLFQQVIPEPVHALVFGKYKEAIRNRQPAQWEEVSTYPAGRKVGEVTVCPVLDANGNCVQLMGMVHDITERKRMEEALQASLKEKEALLGEVHHRVKNNFQLISSLLDMVGMRARNEETIRVCASVQARVHAMGLVHSQLYQSDSFAQIDMEAHVKELVGYLAQVYATNERRITPVIDASGVYLSITQAVSCALVLNEVISNAFKHAFEGRQKGTIKTSIHKSTDGTVLIRVKDDGIGMPEGFDIDKTSTLGLKLTKNLVQEQLKGSIQFRRGNGTEVTIEFKVG